MSERSSSVPVIVQTILPRVDNMIVETESGWSTFKNPNWEQQQDGRSNDNLRHILCDSPPTEVDPSRTCSSSSSVSGRNDMDIELSPNNRLRSERHLGQRSLDDSSHAYDRNLLSKIGGPNTPLRLPSISSLGEAAPSPMTDIDMRSPAVKRLSMPERRRSSAYNSSRQTSLSYTSQSIFDTTDRSNSLGSSSDTTVSHRESHDSVMYQDDMSVKSGSRKRRASSPHAEERRIYEKSPLINRPSPYRSMSSTIEDPPSFRPITVQIIPKQVIKMAEGPPPKVMSINNNMIICDCCPKKPKKFESEEELRMHYMEKQYVCSYCTNRFKNKNEAERHQNSLHLRQHSWCCAALDDYQKAFSSNQTEGSSPLTISSDVCGYCGEEFTSQPIDWQSRRQHLEQVHKFQECNQSKKFFRADHFRQHLKHSHAGTSGKWTNALENACMKDEPPPQPYISSSSSCSTSSSSSETTVTKER